MLTHFKHQSALRIKPWLLALMVSLPITYLPLTAHADISKAEASAKAKSKHGGKVLSVKKTGSRDGKTQYKVKLLLPDGRVKTVTVKG